jgi:hypothetical protein
LLRLLASAGDVPCHKILRQQEQSADPDEEKNGPWFHARFFHNPRKSTIATAMTMA